VIEDILPSAITLDKVKSETQQDSELCYIVAAIGDEHKSNFNKLPRHYQQIFN